MYRFADVINYYSNNSDQQQWTVKTSDVVLIKKCLASSWWRHWWYEPSVRCLTKEEKENLERVCKPLLESKAKSSLPKQSVNPIWSEITKKLAKE